jgi:hypothetical protein
MTVAELAKDLVESVSDAGRLVVRLPRLRELGIVWKVGG